MPMIEDLDPEDLYIVEIGLSALHRNLMAEGHGGLVHCGCKVSKTWHRANAAIGRIPWQTRHKFRRHLMDGAQIVEKEGR
jgi:hypothetical protein